MVRSCLSEVRRQTVQAQRERHEPVSRARAIDEELTSLVGILQVVLPFVTEAQDDEVEEKVLIAQAIAAELRAQAMVN